MKKLTFSCVLLFFLMGVRAQQSVSDTMLNIQLNTDPRLNTLVLKNKEINEEAYAKALRNLQGFRVQVITTNDRNSALSVKTRMLSDFPAEKTYFVYHAPYFKIQMGNFRTREDAEELSEQVKRIYPAGVFIVPSKIELRHSKDGEVLLDVLADIR